MRLCGISSRFQLLSPCIGQVTHALLTRPPLSLKHLHSEEIRRKSFVRLACVRHAASVHPEPGSNSHVKVLYRLLLSNRVPDKNEVLIMSLFQSKLSLANILTLDPKFYFGSIFTVIKVVLKNTKKVFYFFLCRKIFQGYFTVQFSRFSFFSKIDNSYNISYNHIHCQYI